MTAPVSHIHQLGEESSVWFKLTPLLKGPEQPADHPHADGGALRRRHPRQHGQPAHRAADRARALQARAGHQGRRLHQVFRRPEADLRQVDDHPRRRAVAEDPHAAAAGVPPRHVRRVHPLFPGRHPHQDGHLGEARPDRRDRRDGRADLDARRRHDLQGAVRPRHAVQPALRLQVREDLHRRDEPQVDPPQEGGRRGVRDHRGGRGQGHGGVGRRAARGDRRRSARGARAHAAQDDRGGRRRSDDPRVRPAAGRRRAQAVPVGRHRDDGADAGLGALPDLAPARKPPSASAARARPSTATASRRRPTTRRSPTRAP